MKCYKNINALSLFKVKSVYQFVGLSVIISLKGGKVPFHTPIEVFVIELHYQFKH